MTNASLSEYELLRLERIKRNNERLAKLGLLEPTARASTPKRVPVVARKVVAASRTQSPRRSSRRLKRKPALYKQWDKIEVAPRKTRNVNSKKMKAANTILSKFRCEIPMDVSSSPLTEDQKTLINKKMEGNFLERFEVRQI